MQTVLIVEDDPRIAQIEGDYLRSAGFDVLSVEPPREGNPLLELRLPNVILTPHTAWASKGAMQTLADQLIDNVEAFVAGAPRNVVTCAMATSSCPSAMEPTYSSRADLSVGSLSSAWRSAPAADARSSRRAL